jgi:tRNA A-37 threonylcarbamoyl transferase component Bud32
MECLACHTPNVDGARFCAKCGAPLPVQKEADADPLIGTTIGGRYRVTGILGEGGMGRVYTAEQQMGTSVRRVAVKTLLSQFAKDPQTVARFMREVGTVSELEHPNTIKVYDFGQIEGSGELYIAMELLQGKSLDDVLHEHMQHHRAMDPERVDRIIGQVCGSLQEAHDKGIVHRDLKPANIFLTTRAGEEDVVKVLDFGIAKRGSKDSKNEQKLTQQGTILGTPPYMSPEQFTGRELDARSDIYSLAILTYEMLTGQLPFDADTPWQWMTQHMSAQPAPFESLQKAANVPPKMRNAVLRALAKDAGHRPQSAREFFEELTLGNTRMSVVGLGSGGVAAMPVTSSIGGGTAMLRNPTPTGGGMPAHRPMGTQMGEPLFPEGAPGPTQSGYEPYQAGPPRPDRGRPRLRRAAGARSEEERRRRRDRGGARRPAADRRGCRWLLVLEEHAVSGGGGERGDRRAAEVEDDGDQRGERDRDGRGHHDGRRERDRDRDRLRVRERERERFGFGKRDCGRERKRLGDEHHHRHDHRDTSPDGERVEHDAKAPAGDRRVLRAREEARRSRPVQPHERGDQVG